MNGRHWRYFITQAGASIVRSPVVQLVAISTTMVSLTVLCVLVTLSTNVDRMADQWSRGLGIVAFLAEGTSDSTLGDLSKSIGAWPEIESTTVYTREEALTDLRRALGSDRALLDGIDASVLPASIEIVLKLGSRTPSARESVARRLQEKKTFGFVEKIDFGQDMVKRMAGLREILRVGGIAIALLVLSAVIFIITNTVRLTLFARREEIEVMRLVGARNIFIRVPFYLEGAFQGVVGAGLAVGVTWLGVEMVPASEFFSTGMAGVGGLQFISTTTVVSLIAGAGFIGALASHMATGRFLKGQSD